MPPFIIFNAVGQPGGSVKFIGIISYKMDYIVLVALSSSTQSLERLIIF